jgi:hypothetical protein
MKVIVHFLRRISNIKPSHLYIFEVIFFYNWIEWEKNILVHASLKELECIYCSPELVFTDKKYFVKYNRKYFDFGDYLSACRFPTVFLVIQSPLYINL